MVHVEVQISDLCFSGVPNGRDLRLASQLVAAWALRNPPGFVIGHFLAAPGPPWIFFNPFGSPDFEALFFWSPGGCIFWLWHQLVPPGCLLGASAFRCPPGLLLHDFSSMISSR